MNIEKAIEICELVIKSETIFYTQDHYDAVKLLIEAGKRRQNIRHRLRDPAGSLLPGETEE